MRKETSQSSISASTLKLEIPLFAFSFSWMSFLFSVFAAICLIGGTQNPSLCAQPSRVFTLDKLAAWSQLILLTALLRNQYTVVQRFGFIFSILNNRRAFDKQAITEIEVSQFCSTTSHMHCGEGRDHLRTKNGQIVKAVKALRCAISAG